MNKQDVLDLLKTIKYPGFSRDIVSFGMIDNITVDDNNVSVSLKITTEKDDKKQAVIDTVKNVLQSTNTFDKIDVTLSQEGHTPPHTHQQQAPAGPTPLEGIEHIVAIASGKGGVGKSTVAANIAVALTQKGHKVGLLDLDIYGPSLPTILGFNDNPELTQDKN